MRHKPHIFQKQASFCWCDDDGKFLLLAELDKLHIFPSHTKPVLLPLRVLPAFRFTSFPESIMAVSVLSTQ